jgi:hypothetical protein
LGALARRSLGGGGSDGVGESEGRSPLDLIGPVIVVAGRHARIPVCCRTGFLCGRAGATNFVCTSTGLSISPEHWVLRNEPAQKGESGTPTPTSKAREDLGVSPGDASEQGLGTEYRWLSTALALP